MSSTIVTIFLTSMFHLQLYVISTTDRCSHFPFHYNQGLMDNSPVFQLDCLAKTVLESLHHQLPIHFSDLYRHKLLGNIRQRVNIAGSFPRHGIGLDVCPVPEEGGGGIGERPRGCDDRRQICQPEGKTPAAKSARCDAKSVHAPYS